MEMLSPYSLHPLDRLTCLFINEDYTASSLGSIKRIFSESPIRMNSFWIGEKSLHVNTGIASPENSRFEQSTQADYPTEENCCVFFPVSEVASRPEAWVDNLLPEIQGQGHPAVSHGAMVECFHSGGQHPADGEAVWQETPLFCSLFYVEAMN